MVVRGLPVPSPAHCTHSLACQYNAVRVMYKALSNPRHSLVCGASSSGHGWALTTAVRGATHAVPHLPWACIVPRTTMLIIMQPPCWSRAQASAGNEAECKLDFTSARHLGDSITRELMA